MTNKERIELYRAQREAAEALCQHARADAHLANLRADYAEQRFREMESIANERLDRIKLMEAAYETSKRTEKHLRDRINELEAALAAIEDREAVDADPQLDAHQRGVEDGIERVGEVKWFGVGEAASNAIVQESVRKALASFRAEPKEQTDDH